MCDILVDQFLLSLFLHHIDILCLMLLFDLLSLCILLEGFESADLARFVA